MMIDLERTVRFCINPPAPPGSDGAADDLRESRSNTFSAWPAMRGVGRFYEFVVTCRGRPDAETGYFMNIKKIDAAVRETAIPVITEAVRVSETTACPTRLILAVWPRLDEALGGSLRQVRWKLTPWYSVGLEPDSEAPSVKHPGRLVIRQNYEFAASHRLHVDRFSPDENQAYFGKCNNENGHGHNYRVEVAVMLGESEREIGQPFSVGLLDRVVDATIIERFDHKHLNLDCPEFADVNPSVENIARVCHDLLVDPLRGQGMALKEVTVWETEKTRCTYPA